MILQWIFLFLSPTHETIKKYQESFGDDYFYFSFQGVFFIVLNSQLYQDHTHVPDLYEGTVGPIKLWNKKTTVRLNF